ncbi:hypothetical protein FHX16_006322 [Rhizobium sp. BK661]|nr:hypothetical protein [Rhizobium sp. BK661]
MENERAQGVARQTKGSRGVSGLGAYRLVTRVSGFLALVVFSPNLGV